MKRMRIVPFLALLALAAPRTHAQEPWVATPLTEKNSFTGEIEGPAVDRDGNIFAVSFARKPTIGRVTPDGKGELWLDMPEGSTGNSIRFDRAGTMYVADYTGHNVLRIDPRTKKVEVFSHEPRMNQPNDLAITANGEFFASDPNWKDGTGQIWHINREGRARRVADNMGTTNGIDISPDGKTLYVNESVQRKVWAFDIGSAGALTNKRLLIAFPDFGFDGMRVDVDGKLYITRHGKGTVAVVSPAGVLVREVPVLGSKPSNICFGGPDGRTAYVTEMEHGRLVQFRTERPGLEFERNRPRAPRNIRKLEK
ncbi:MAG: SMP-30/gluconolactonase/LRE family protein [Acidobacteria bacterium]|nr:SMP-30/gluconolactonase/LRE family protein [Acidobacteriota bacterium]